MALLTLRVKLPQLALPRLSPPHNLRAHSGGRRIVPSLLQHRSNVRLQQCFALCQLLAQGSKRALLSAGVRLMRSLQPGNPTPRIITNNSITAPLAYWGDRTTNDPNVTVTFSVDMSRQVASGNSTNGLNTVTLRGNFNNWGETAMAPNPDPDTNIYSTVLDLPFYPLGASCSTEYKFYSSAPSLGGLSRRLRRSVASSESCTWSAGSASA